MRGNTAVTASVEETCRELARYLNPRQPGKTLIFCSNNRHAQQVCHYLQGELIAAYGDEAAASVECITATTGDVDKAVMQFRNERMPRIATTVELLATGIDLPGIVNLVFLRLIRSRRLFYQMLGRATRRCPEIAKSSYRIFDAVGVTEIFPDFAVTSETAVP